MNAGPAAEGVRIGGWIQIIGREEDRPLFAPILGPLDVLRETPEQIRPIRHDAPHPRGVGPEDLLVPAADGCGSCGGSSAPDPA